MTQASKVVRAAMAATTSALVLAACGGGGEAPGTPSPKASARPSSPAKIRIVEPTPGAVVAPDHVPVRIELTGARLTKKVSTHLSPTEGHVHLSLDGRIVTLLGGLDEDVAKLLGHPLKPGPHLLQAEFVASDHGPFIPRVISSVSFTVR